MAPSVHARSPSLTSARAYLRPEGVDAAVPLVRYLLEWLVRLVLEHFEAGARNQLRDGPAEFGATGHVTATGEHERGDDDLPEAVARVVLDHGVEEACTSALDCLCGKASTSSMNRSTVPSLCARGV